MSDDQKDGGIERIDPGATGRRIGPTPVSPPPTGSPILVSAPEVEPPPDRFSVLRLLIALVVIAIGMAAGVALVIGLVTREKANDEQWFAPYVDVTLTPQLDFQDPSVNPNLDVVLAFVVASADDPCAPSWGSYYGLDEAATSLDLDRRIARQRQRGGDVIVSFGGIANDELATGCTDPTELVDAYRSVVSRYDARTIDLDLEGAALADDEIASRRATAMATLQADARENDRDLEIWLTLPVSPTGLTADGVAALDAMLAAGVDVAGVNVMTMDFGASRDGGTDMVTASIAAVDATQVQLVSAYAAGGTTLSPTAAYARIGVTPMIGQNDVPADRLDTTGAQELVDQTRDRGVKRYSMWSLNRDAPCGGNVDAVIVSNTCSGVEQVRLEFSSILGTVGSRPADDERAESPAVVRGSATETESVGPYDTWRERREYDARAEVVWAGQVYVAKWWNVGIAPDAPVEHEWDSPWRLVGPVLESDATATTATTLPDGTFAEWTRDSDYDAGDWVQRRGVVYRAKWWTRGVDPTANVDNSWESPWEPVGVDDLDAATATTTTTTTTPSTTTPGQPAPATTTTDLPAG